VLTRNQRQLKAVEQEMERHGGEADAILKRADEEDRETTPKEKEEIEDHLKAIKTLKDTKADLEDAIKVEDEVRELGRKIGAEDQQGDGSGKSLVVDEGSGRINGGQAKSLGEQFVQSKQYKGLIDRGLSGTWSSGVIDLEAKTLLTEGTPTGAGVSSGGAGALVGIDVRPGIMPILFPRLRVVNLIAGGTTSSNSIRYLVESLATNNAKVVPEGGTKPESALEFDYTDESVQKIATWLPVTDEMLEDGPAIQSYINARLTLFVQQKEEEEILHGAGGGNFLGIMPRVPVANRYVSSDADAPNTADHVYEALTVARRSFLEPDGIVMHPDDWSDLRLLKDQNENYIGGSPFSNTGAGEPAETLWNKPVVVTEAMVPGAALVGAFGTAAQFFRRGGLSVEASNSHSDFFVLNKTAIRAEERGVLAVYRPQSFAIADIGYAS
jgi:HK97 family phage major capsid protein